MRIQALRLTWGAGAWWIAGVLAVAAALIVLAGRADAAFPGQNGKIAFTSIRDGNTEVYKMNADGTNPKNLTNNTAYDSAPAWSPDGSKIAFTSDRDGNDEVYKMNADGTNPKNMTANPAFFDVGPDWQPL